MASSALAALKKALLVAVCVMLLHSSMGQQPPTTLYTGQQPPPPPPASSGCPYTGQQPPPPSPTPVVPAPTPTPTTPTPVPAPMPTPLAPAPAPINCNYSDCGWQCTASCNAGFKPQNCTKLVEDVFNECYNSLAKQTCPGKSCDHSGCGFTTCSCDNPRAASICDSCLSNLRMATIVGSPYWLCQHDNERYMGNCMRDCMNRCSKNCTQGA